MATAALNIIPINKDTDLKTIIVGNSVFTDDEWDLSPLIPNKSLTDSVKIIRFAYIPNNMRFV